MTAVLVVGLLGAVTALVQELRRRKAEQGLRDAQAEALLHQGRADRLERVVEEKRREYVEALETLGECHDPAAARFLVHRLLQDPWLGAPAGTPLRDPGSP